MRVLLFPVWLMAQVIDVVLSFMINTWTRWKHG